MPLERLDHVLVLTDDLEATRAFYCEALGLEVGERPPLEFPGYWLYLDGVPCVHVAERGPYEAHAAGLGLPATPSPLDHVAFAAGDYPELEARLEAAGVAAVTNEVPAAGLRQLFFTDPNGVRIELNVRWVVPFGGTVSKS
jgi:catechol 2,3-dioxygenase-like lactoylglutathione lyase family enzyme